MDACRLQGQRQRRTTTRGTRSGDRALTAVAEPAIHDGAEAVGLAPFGTGVTNIGDGEAKMGFALSDLPMQEARRSFANSILSAIALEMRYVKRTILTARAWLDDR
jgi:hypothetical protein